jgi:organic hydroperoxide reductase OsmC/OhrA
MATIAPFPHTYTVRLDEGRLRAPPREPIVTGPPPQFGGTDRVWSPEELLVGAALACLWTTFEAFARRDRLAVARWAGTGAAVLDRAPGVPVFTSLTLRVELEVTAGDEDRARRLIENAEDRCIISKALRVPVTLQVTVTSTAAPPLRKTGA